MKPVTGGSEAASCHGRKKIPKNTGPARPMMVPPDRTRMLFVKGRSFDLLPDYLTSGPLSQ
jgi:hypothetical protein